MRADDVRAPAAVAPDAGEERVEERFLDAVRVHRIAGEQQQLALEADPVHDVAELRHAVHAVRGMDEMVEAPDAPHRVEFLLDEVSLVGEDRVEDAAVAREPVPVGATFEAAQDLVGLRPERRIRVPFGDRFGAERVVQNRARRAGVRRERADRVLREREGARVAGQAVQLQERAQDARRRDAVPRAGLVERQAEAAQLRGEVVGHLLRGREAFGVAADHPGEFHERPERVFSAPDVETGVVARIGAVGVAAQQVLVRVGRKVAVRLLEFADERMGLVERPGGERGVAPVGGGAREAEHRLAPVFVLPAPAPAAARIVVPMRSEGVLGLRVHRPLRPVRAGAGADAGLGGRADGAEQACVARAGRRKRVADLVVVVDVSHGFVSWNGSGFYHTSSAGATDCGAIMRDRGPASRRDRLDGLDRSDVRPCQSRPRTRVQSVHPV